MCHNHDLSDADRALIVEKIGKLRKFFDRILEVSVILDSTKKTAMAEILTFGPQMNLRFKADADDMRTAFEEALNKAERGLRKTKNKKWGDKMKGRNNVTIRRFNPMDFDFAEERPREESTDEEMIRQEALEAKPMSLEEAHLQLKARDKGLLVFVNAKTENVNILHRNADNEVELVELEGSDIPEEQILEMYLEQQSG